MPTNPTAEYWTRIERERLGLIEALRDLVERIDINGGLGEYKGGQAFALKRAHALLARLDGKGGDRENR